MSDIEPKPLTPETLRDIFCRWVNTNFAPEFPNLKILASPYDSSLSKDPEMPQILKNATFAHVLFSGNHGLVEDASQLLEEQSKRFYPTSLRNLSPNTNWDTGEYSREDSYMFGLESVNKKIKEN